jgi:hypothetical protein
MKKAASGYEKPAKARPPKAKPKSARRKPIIRYDREG